jgi:hypothetical protein
MKPTSMAQPSIPTAGTAPVQLRPLSTGELIDRGFSLYRAHFAGFLLLSLICQIAPLVAGQALDTAARLIPSKSGFSGSFGPNLAGDAVLLVIWIIGQVVTFCFEVVMSVYLADAYLGRLPSIKTAFRRLFTTLGASVRTSLLNIFLVAVTLLFPMIAFTAVYIYGLLHPPETFPGQILFSIGAVVALVVSLVPVLIVFMRLMVTVPAVALENLGGWKAARRSSDLVRFDPGLGFFYWGETRLSLLLLPLFVIELMALVVTAFPLWLHEVNDFLRHGSIGQMTAPPETAVVVSQILVLLFGSLIFPLYLIATTLFYYDVRIRREGFDLEFMAGRMEGGA